MSKKGKKEEKEIRQVNTDVDVENAYYNYDTPVVYETKKPSFFKKLFRGKKTVKKSSDIGVQEDNFYGNFQDNDTENEISYDNNYQEEPKEEPVFETPKKNVEPPVVNNNSYDNSYDNTYGNKYTQGYDYTEPFNEDEKTKTPSSKNMIYGIGALLFAGLIIFVVIKTMSKATEDYYINVGTTTIALRPYEGEQITYLTNDSKKTTFTTNDSSIITVNEFGYVQAKGYKANEEGYMKGTVTVGAGSTVKTIDVYVIPTSVSIPMEDFTVPNNIEIKLNQKVLIEISNITPPNNTRQVFDYISNDNSIAEVSSVGVITGRKVGTTTIEVRNHYNKRVSKTINVTVK